jgi:hypothetical protein
MNKECLNKIVVFDLDETLGYFTELGMFWDSLTKFLRDNSLNTYITKYLFFSLIDLFPEFLRPNIINILKYLKKQKDKNKCSKLLIYTNNQGPKYWAQYIIGYFEGKIGSKLFDQIIAAFKVNGKQIELCRTTHSKNHEDLIRCTKISEDTQICFIDDVFYPDMSKENIYYINIKPYIYDLSFHTMIDRLKKSKIFVELNFTKNMIIECEKTIYDNLVKYNFNYNEKNKKSQEIDSILSKKILHHLEIFFKDDKYKNLVNRTQTKRNIQSVKGHNRTLKKRVK